MSNWLVKPVLIRYLRQFVCLGTVRAEGCWRAERSKMVPLRIRPTATKEVRGDLRATFDDDQLLLPERVSRLFSALGVRTAADLASYLQAFPSAIAGELGWEPEDVVHAWKLLRAQLKGRVDAEILDPSSHPSPAFGALPPPAIKHH